jgi:hypothetical protein
VTTLPPGEALFHLSVKVGQRSKGRSAVAKAAYDAAVRISNAEGRVFDYRKKSGVVDSFILAPVGAPAWVSDRQALWTRAEAAERRKDATLYRELEISLPRDLPRELWRPLIIEACAPYLATDVPCDVALHCPRAADGYEQPHAHILLPTRAVDGTCETGFASAKSGALTAIFESGGRHGGERGEALQAERGRWASLLNTYLREVGSLRRTDARSYAERGVVRLPEPKLGEGRLAAHRKRRKKGEHSRDRRLAHANAVRALRKAETEAMEIEMAIETESPSAFGAKRPSTAAKSDIKVKLLRQRVPDVDLGALPEDALYMIKARDGKPLRCLMRDDSWAEYSDGRVRYWGGPGQQSQAAILAEAIGRAEGVDDVSFQPHSAVSQRRGRRRRPDGQPFPRRRLEVSEARAIAERWRARGYTDVDESPDGVWVSLGSRTRLQDTGDRLDVHGKVDADALRALCLKAAEDWGGSMELYGSDQFKREAWLAAMRAGIDVQGYDPGPELRRHWEQEQQRMSPGGAVAAVKDSAQAAQLLKRAAGGDAEAGRRLDPALKAFLYGYGAGNSGQLAALASAEIGDLVPELARFKFYGRAWLDPVETGGVLAAWAEGDEAAPAPGCPEIARLMREALAAGRTPDEATVDVLVALGVAKDGEVLPAEDLARVVERNLARAAGQPVRKDGQGHPVEMKPNA